MAIEKQTTKFVPIVEPFDDRMNACPCGGHITNDGSQELPVTNHTIGGYIEVSSFPLVYHCSMCNQAFLLVLNS